MESSEERRQGEAASAAEEPKTVNIGGVTVKLVYEEKDTPESAMLKAAAARATEIARERAFRRNLPVYVYRDGKVREIYANGDVR